MDMTCDENPQEVRTRERHKARTEGKETTTRTGAAAPAGRDTPDGSQADSPFCVVLKTYHLSWYLPQRMLETL